MKLSELFFGSAPQPLELKAESVKAKIDMPQAPALEITPWSLGRYASKSEVVYACIEKKAQVACDPVLVIQEKNSKGEWNTVDEHRALDTLITPNPYDDGESFLRTWIASENIAGVFFAEIVRNGAGEPVQLFPLRPDCIYPQYIRGNKGDVLDYYAYRINGYEVRYKPEELLIHRRHGLGSMYSGLSPLAVALASVDADIAATEYVRDFFNNDGTPAGILKITGRNLSDDEAQRLQQKWKSNYSRNGKNRGGVAILDDRAAYETVGARLNELDSESLTSIDETRICMAFGVPPVIIGAYVGLRNVNQRASFKGAMEEFWMNTMSPELKAIRNFLTHRYLVQFEEDKVKAGKLRFFWDISNVEALQEDVDAIHDRVALGYKTGFYKLDEARSKVGLDPVGPALGGEEFYKPTPAVQEPKEEDEEEDETLVEKRMRRLLEKIAPMKPGDILSATTLEKKTFEYEGLTLSREPTEIEKGIDLKAISDSMDPAELLTAVLEIRDEMHRSAAKAASKLTDADIHTLTLVPPANAYKKVRKPIEAAVEYGRQQVLGEKSGFGPDQVKGIVDEIIDRLVDLTVARIVSTVSTAVIDIVTALGVLGRDRDEIEDELVMRLDERSDRPYENIARQSINSAVNAGRSQGMRDREGEIEKYVYSAILDKNTCETCKAWDGAEADRIDQLPPTPNPECSGGANCRCFIISVFATEVGASVE